MFLEINMCAESFAPIESVMLITVQYKANTQTLKPFTRKISYDYYKIQIFLKYLSSLPFFSLGMLTNPE